MAREIGINELPAYSPWPARLLFRDRPKPERTPETILAEYNKVKWASLLNYWNTHSGVSIRALLKFGETGNGKCAFSTSSKLYLEDWDVMQNISDSVLIKVLKPYVSLSNTIIELGCGWGYNLFTLQSVWKNKYYIGGDLCPNAVKLGMQIARSDSRMSYKVFNFMDNNWTVFDKINTPAIIITRHAIEQLPSAQHAITQLVRHKDKIAAVIHLEPVCVPREPTLLSLLRIAYTEANNYNTDLLKLAQDNSKKIHFEYDVCGINPLNPTSLLVWQP
jgi:hypothetical protein